MKLCILENDVLDGELAQRHGRIASLFAQLFETVRADWSMDVFNTVQGDYPASFDPFDAVLLTGSRADSFSDAPWVARLREQVSALLAARKPMAGVCFGHQLIALCLGAPVARAPQGWGAGRMGYAWHRPELPHAQGRTEIALLASHQDQVLALPPGAQLAASSDFCPVAAYTVGDHVMCVQAHPEFVESVSAHLLQRRRTQLGEARYASSMASLAQGHEGAAFARMLVGFITAAVQARQGQGQGQGQLTQPACVG